MFHCLEYDIYSRGNKMEDQIKIQEYVLTIFDGQNVKDICQGALFKNQLKSLNTFVNSVLSSCKYCDDIEDMTDDRYEILFEAVMAKIKNDFRKEK